MQKSTTFTIIFRVKKTFTTILRVKNCHFHYDMQIIVYYIKSDRNASLYKSENFDRRVRLRTSGTLLTSFILAFRSRMIYDVLSYSCNNCKKSKK
jgi:hypothetical protein